MKARRELTVVQSNHSWKAQLLCETPAMTGSGSRHQRKLGGLKREMQAKALTWNIQEGSRFHETYIYV